MLILICILLSVLFVMTILSPFIIWSVYFKLWCCVLFDYTKGITLVLKLKQSLFLLRYLMLCPIYSLLWYLDEIFCGDYINKDVPAAVCIIGQPRSGTTFLHRTLASDNNNFFSLRHIEWRFPFVLVHRVLKLLGVYNYICRISYWSNKKSGVNAAKMHASTLGDWEEDGIFFEERFLFHYFIFRRFPYPSVVEGTHDFIKLTEKEQAKLLNIHSKVIRKFYFYNNQNGKIVLLKENESMKIMPELSKTFPNIKYIFIGRLAKDFLNSYEALSINSTQSKTSVDPTTIDGWYEANIWKRKEECIEQIKFLNENLSDDKQVRVTFYQFVNNIYSCVDKIYNKLGLAVDKEYKAYLIELMGKQQNRDRGYDIEIQDMEGFEFFDEFVRKI